MVVTITPGTWDVATTTLPWALVEVVTTFTTALTAAAGTAVAASLFSPGIVNGAALLELPSCGEDGFEAGELKAALLSLDASLGAGATLELPSFGEAGFATGEFGVPPLSFAAWFEEVPA